MFSYKLIDGGYEIYANGCKILYQPHSPNRGTDVLLTPQEAEGLAKLICAKLEQGVDPLVLPEEEQEIIAGATDERINEMAAVYADELKRRKQEQEQNDLTQRITDLEIAMAAILGGAK